MSRVPSYLVTFVFSLVIGILSTASVADPPDGADRGSGSSAVPQDGPPLIVAPEPLAIRIDPARAYGSPAATIAIVEFADYQCPYCRAFHIGTLPKLQSAYVETRKVRYVYKDFPLPSHAHAFGASVAAHCAGAQGRYWQMQELLYAEQARLGNALYAELAEELELNTEQFQACLTSGPPRQAVNHDLSEGRRLGVRGTPTFIIGRIEQDRVVVERITTGAPAFEVFASELEALSR